MWALPVCLRRFCLTSRASPTVSPTARESVITKSRVTFGLSVACASVTEIATGSSTVAVSVFESLRPSFMQCAPLASQPIVAASAGIVRHAVLRDYCEI